MPRPTLSLPKFRTAKRRKPRPKRKRPSKTAAQVALGGGPSPKERLSRRMGKSFASAALATEHPIGKAALAGAAVGSEIEASVRAYKREKAAKTKTKGKKTQGTVSQSAAAQKRRFHKKDLTTTKSL